MKRLAWIDRLSKSIEEDLGTKCMKAILTGGEDLTSSTSPRKKAEWVAQAMQRLSESCSLETGKHIMSGCSCFYPKRKLHALKNIYEKDGIQAFVRTIQEDRKKRILWGLGYDENLLRKAEPEP